ncbi:MAG: hypothetical protein WDM92_10090 [Caulobacteraceae bacterium]
MKTYVLCLRDGEEHPPQIIACTSDVEAAGRAFTLLSMNPDCDGVRVTSDNAEVFRIERSVAAASHCAG